jgi:hypothetical protein
MAQPEHNLQVQVVKFVRDCVDAPHVFLGFDRSRKQSAMQHVREKSRGLRAGTADTLLLVKGMVPIWVELKVGDGKPTETQYQFAQDVTSVGCHWHWVSSVDSYRKVLQLCCVPLRPNAVVVAAHLDALLAGTAARKAAKPPRSYRKPRAPAPSRAALAACRRGVWAK